MNRSNGGRIQRWSRRAALKTFGSASAGVLLAPTVLRSQSAPLVVNGTPVEVMVASISPSTVRLTVVPIEGGAVPRDGALVSAAAGKSVARHRDAFPAVKAGNLVVKVTREPLALAVETAAGTRVQSIGLDAQAPALTFALGKGPLLGLGEGAPQFDRKGHVYANRNGQGGYQLRTHGSRVPIQWLVSTDGWGLFVHRPLGAFDLTGANGVVTPGTASLPVDVFVTASPDPTTIMREYARITGLAELPPLWSFGYMQSHRTLAGPDEIMWVARTFREKKLPCDALIYLGTEFTPSGWNTRNGEFDWKRENFPDPRRAIEELHAQHYKVVLHVVIEGRRMAGAVSDPCTPDKAVPSGRTPADRWPEDRAVECYWPYHQPLYALGVDGMWPDQGDGLDEPSRLARIRMYWEGPQQYRPDERPFALHRNGAPGMQRYGAFLWSGDVFSTWETLKTHIPIAVNTSLSGLPFWGTDIGGFVPTVEYTGELHVRWFQFGTFCPSFRAHGRNWHLRLPWGWNAGKIPPSEIRASTSGAADPDPAELKNPNVEPIVRKYLELRYRLLPYTYSVARECTQSGLPMMRALWLHHPGDAAAIARGDQFLWGRDILVSPVVEKGATTRRLYLPAGKWFDFWTNQVVDGGREIDRSVDLETMPLHVRAGAIVPFAPVRQYVDEPVAAPTTITVYPGADGAFTLYEDDGKSFAYRRGEWMGIEMAWADAARRLTLRLASGSRMMGAARTLEVRVAGDQASRAVRFSGSLVDVRL
jgi:alpha-glucosidase (family GH31 glycosyl hydrolase)